MRRSPDATDGPAMNSKHSVANTPDTKEGSDPKVASALEKLRLTYRKALLSHQRDGIYSYLEAIYSRTQRLTEKGGQSRAVERLASATGRKFRSDTSLPSALIQ